jgi:lipopolysaccharide export system protein LptC
VSSNGEEVELVDNVKVVRQAFEDKGEMQVLTEKLIILPNQDLVKTDSPVVITQAPKTVIHATGMIYDKKNQTVKLLKHVKVHYERPIVTKPTKSHTTKPEVLKVLSALKTNQQKISQEQKTVKKAIKKTLRSKP